jgi:hypothetical protein
VLFHKPIDRPDSRHELMFAPDADSRYINIQIDRMGVGHYLLVNSAKFAK